MSLCPLWLLLLRLGALSSVIALAAAVGFHWGGGLLEPVRIQVSGPNQADASLVSVVYAGWEGGEGELPQEGASLTWVSERQQVKKLWLRLPREQLSRIQSVQIEIGPKRFHFDSAQLKRDWRPLETVRDETRPEVELLQLE